MVGIRNFGNDVKVIVNQDGGATSTLVVENIEPGDLSLGAFPADIIA